MSFPEINSKCGEGRYKIAIYGGNNSILIIIVLHFRYIIELTSSLALASMNMETQHETPHQTEHPAARHEEIIRKEVLEDQVPKSPMKLLH